MTALDRDSIAFKRAVIFSITAHLTLFLLIILSPYLPKSSQKGMIHYVNLISVPGGGGSGGPSGGGGGGEEKVAETALPKRETLKDLTTPQKIQEEPASSLRYPVEKPKKGRKPKKEKKAVIQKQASSRTKKSKADSSPGPGSGTGSGIRIGGGSGSGSGFESAYSSQIGLSNFPFTYYLQIIIDRVSNNWFTYQVDPGVLGYYQTTVYFKIYKNGQVSDLKIEESSRIKSMDLSALRAIQTSAPFPPLPKAYDNEYLGIHLIFEHSK